MGSSSTSSDLRSKISKLCHTNAHGKEYIPSLSLRDLLTYENVYSELQNAGCEPQRLKEITNAIVPTATKIFAVLVLLEKVLLVKDLMRVNKLQDSRLPFQTCGLDHLDAIDAAYFCKKQWLVQSPHFSRGTILQQINPKAPLPFLNDSLIGEGGFGSVFEISLDPSHHELSDEFRKRLVRKELDPAETILNDSGDELVELENLAILNLLKHPNIVELLTAYRYNGRDNLVFRLAEGGDLSDLLGKEREQGPFHCREDLLIALAGLSSAIEHVHNFLDDNLNLRLIGYHNDLRPRNILVSGKSLLLTDFGLSKFKKSSENSNTNSKPGIGAYLAPECEDLDNGFRKLTVDRSTDIWSFGCIILEMVIHMNFGLKGLEEFRKDRQYTLCENRWMVDYFHKGSVPNPAINTWLSKTESAGSGSSALLVNLIRRILSLQKTDRPKAEKVTAYLRLLVLVELAKAITDRFTKLCEPEEPLDALLQQWRFDGWRDGQGILDLGDVGSMFDSSAGSIHALEFQPALDCLLEMRNCLDQMSSSHSERSSAGFRKLEFLNDRLIDLLDKERRERARIRFLAMALESEFSTSLENRHSDFNVHAAHHEMQKLAALKTMSKLAKEHKIRDTSHWQIDSSLIKHINSFGHHALALLLSGTEKRVLVEWRNYTRQEVKSGVLEKLFVRLERITQMEKPQEFCSLLCQGFFHQEDQGRFGVIYNLPEALSAVSRSDPINLAEIIRSTTNKRDQPVLDDKFSLAYTLARAVSKFHLAGWLHKDLSSANVIFAPVNEKPLCELIRKPYLIGFNHSRPDEPLAYTEGISESISGEHQHPDYRRDGEGYCQEYDYYSLGLLLLQIGHWKTLESITKKYENDNARDLRRHILDRQVPLLRQYMGSTYYEVVKTCVAGDPKKIDPAEEGTQKVALHVNFQKLVVERLRALSAEPKG